MLSSAVVNRSLFSKIHVTVDGRKLVGEDGDTIRKLLIQNHIQIPSHCGGQQQCNLCKVLVDGETKLACATDIEEGMNISTKSEKIKQEVLEQMRKLEKAPNVDNAIHTVQKDKHKPTYIDDTTNSIQIDNSKCIDCGKCISTCGNNVLIKDGHVQPAGGFGLRAAGCTACGKCVDACPTKAISYTNNIPLYKEAFAESLTAKIAVLDMSIMYHLEKEFKLPPGSVKLNDILCLLKNLGFQYFLDASLITDYDILNDSARIYRHRTKGYSGTIGAFCISLLKKLINVDSVGADQVAEVFLGPESLYTTFVVSGCYARRSASTLYMGTPYKYLSVGITTNEFISIIKEKCGSNIETLFKGSPCQALPLGSREGCRADTAERFSDSVVRTYGSLHLGMQIKPLEFQKVKPNISLADVNITSNYKLAAAVVERAQGFDELMKMDLQNLLYITPRECPPSPGPDPVLQRKDQEADTRSIKLSRDNGAAHEIWSHLRKLDDYETFVKKATGNFD